MRIRIQLFTLMQESVMRILYPKIMRLLSGHYMRLNFLHIELTEQILQVIISLMSHILIFRSPPAILGLVRCFFT
jgi:hypothetical protein